MKDAILNVLKELEVQSNLERSRKVDVMPEERMLAITKESGRYLNIVLRLRSAKNVLEIGMSAGYSTLWCAEAVMGQSGKIITIEQNPKKIKRAEKNFSKAGVSDTITIKRGLAMDILSEMSLQKENECFFDFVLIDADKENVIRYFDLIFPMLAVRGVVVTDNMLYPEKYRQDMKKFSAYLREYPRVKTVTLPLGNGLETTVKIR